MPKKNGVDNALSKIFRGKRDAKDDDMQRYANAMLQKVATSEVAPPPAPAAAGIGRPPMLGEVLDQRQRGPAAWNGAGGQPRVPNGMDFSKYANANNCSLMNNPQMEANFYNNVGINGMAPQRQQGQQGGFGGFEPQQFASAQQLTQMRQQQQLQQQQQAVGFNANRRPLALPAPPTDAAASSAAPIPFGRPMPPNMQRPSPATPSPPGSPATAMAQSGVLPSVPECQRITDHIWLGNRNAVNVELLNALGVRYVINAAKELKTRPDIVDWQGVKDAGIIVMHVPWMDTMEQQIFPSPELNAAIQWLDQIAASGNRVLVNCNMGKSRSTSLVISYMIIRKGFSYDRALADVRSKRPVAQPNGYFEQQLRLIEAAVRLRNTSDASGRPLNKSAAAQGMQQFAEASKPEQNIMTGGQQWQQQLQLQQFQQRGPQFPSAADGQQQPQGQNIQQLQQLQQQIQQQIMMLQQQPAAGQQPTTPTQAPFAQQPGMSVMNTGNSGNTNFQGFNNSFGGGLTVNNNGSGNQFGGNSSGFGALNGFGSNFQQPPSSPFGNSSGFGNTASGSNFGFGGFGNGNTVFGQQQGNPFGQTVFSSAPQQFGQSALTSGNMPRSTSSRAHRHLEPVSAWASSQPQAGLSELHHREHTMA